MQFMSMSSPCKVARDQEVHLMTAKRTVPTLLVCASLMALVTSGCWWGPYHRRGGGRRHLTSLDTKVEAPTAPAVAAR